MVEEIDCRLGRGTHLAHLNCQSAYNKMDSIKLHLNICKFDILTLSETWFHKLHSDQSVELEGYRVVREDRGVLNNLQTAECRQQTADGRQQSADSRVQTAVPTLS